MEEQQEQTYNKLWQCERNISGQCREMGNGHAPRAATITEEYQRQSGFLLVCRKMQKNCNMMIDRGSFSVLGNKM
jgi:hypothetical protein